MQYSFVKIALGSCFFILFHSLSWAQVSSVGFYGTVRQQGNGEALQGATVFVVEPRKGTQTDRQGFYMMALKPGRYTVKFSSLGFKPIFKEIELNNQDVQFDIELEEDTRLLEELTVTSDRPEANVQRIEIGVSRLSIRSIQKIPAFMGEVDVMRSLLMLPGVSTVGEGTTGLNIRGGSIDQNLVLMDEAPLFNTSHLFGFFSVFNQDAVRDVNLQRGGISAQYGGRASSILDVRLKYPNSEQFSVGGGIGLVSSRLTVEGPLIKNKLSTLVAVRASFNDFLFQIGPKSLRDTRANFYDITNKWLWNINDRNELTLSAYYSHDTFKIPADSVATLDVNASSSLFGYSSLASTLNWTRHIREGVRLEAVGTLSRYDARISVPDSVNALDLVSAITYTSGKFQYTHRTGAPHQYLAGLSTIGYTLLPNDLRSGPLSNVLPLTLETERATELAAFAEDEWKINPRLSMMVGLRYSAFLRQGPGSARVYAPDQAKTDESVLSTTQYGPGETMQLYHGLEPRLAMRWIMTPATSFKMGYNRMRQYIHMVSNTTAALPTSRWALSGPHLRPQISDQLSAGVFRNFKNDTYETSAEVYYKTIQDALDFKDGADILLSQALEMATLQGQGRAYGIELLAKKNTGFWTGWVSYTYARTFLQMNGAVAEERINGGRWYPANFDRPHTLNAMAIYRPSVTVTASFNFTLSSGRAATFPYGRYVLNDPTIFGINVPIYLDRNQDRIPAYHRLDFSLTFDQNPDKHPERRWKGSWVFSLYNVYARRNAFSVFYNLRPYAPTEAYKLTIFGTIFPSLTYNFKWNR